ncbi:MAG: aldose 1-epimerase [Eubacteriales bacterium]|nr:aldose 1-epimerase [Eubacteriales bacterium]
MGKITHGTRQGYDIVTLEHLNQRVSIAPQLGGNWFSWQLGELELRGPAPLDAPRDTFGTPVLFPTPNRVRACTYTFQGREIHQQKNGAPRFLHGLILDEPLHIADSGADDTQAYLTLQADFMPGTALYEGFPFPCALKLHYSLCKLGLEISYTVENKGEGQLPFGFGLHPYFAKLEDEATTYLRAPVTQVYQNDATLLPTGDMLDVQDHPELDLRRWRDLAGLDLDYVYRGVPADAVTAIRYEKTGITIELSASPEFSHLVVYTPKDLPVFAIENQSCCTDAHNMYAKGHADTCGLIVLEPGQTHRGYVRFGVNENQ